MPASGVQSGSGCVGTGWGHSANLQIKFSIITKALRAVKLFTVSIDSKLPEKKKKNAVKALWIVRVSYLYVCDIEIGCWSGRVTCWPGAGGPGSHINSPDVWILCSGKSLKRKHQCQACLQGCSGSWSRITDVSRAECRDRLHLLHVTEDVRGTCCFASEKRFGAWI